MTDLLLELFSEEIPARMQEQATGALLRIAREKLAAAGLPPGEAVCHATPRRLVLLVRDLPPVCPGHTEVIRGPRTDAPEQAIRGFLSRHGLERVEQAGRMDTPGGPALCIRKTGAERPAADILMTCLPEIVTALPWPKSMRWEDHELRWPRPLRRVLCLLGDQVLPVRIGHLTADRYTEGARTCGRPPFPVASVRDYPGALGAHGVILSAEERRDMIRQAADRLAREAGARLVPDPALLRDLAGLTEYPVPLPGRYDPGFLSLPREVIVTSMRHHQKYFSLETPGGKLAPLFIVVAGHLPPDGGKAVIAGNERVLKARLSDAMFFFRRDLGTPPEQFLERLGDMQFHARLGSLRDKARRLERLAPRLCQWFPGTCPGQAARAGLLAKTDLVSGTVGELPELQGMTGRFLAEARGEAPEIAAAIGSHHAPLGPRDTVPAAPLSALLATADKADTLTGLFLAGERASGSRDPLALRRTALGLVRILLENGIDLPLGRLPALCLGEYRRPHSGYTRDDSRDDDALCAEISGFLLRRLRIHLREAGFRHDLVAAVLDLPDEDRLPRIRQRLEALAALVESRDGADLLACWRRAASILRDEERKGALPGPDMLDPALLEAPAERELHSRLAETQEALPSMLARGDFARAGALLALLRAPVDRFFTDVIVNSDRPEIRQNRLSLLSALTSACEMLARFSRIEG